MYKLLFFSAFYLVSFFSYGKDNCHIQEKLKVNDAIQSIRPGQKDYSLPRVDYLIRKFTKDSDKDIQKYLDKKLIPYIYTPKGKRLILDRHHFIQGVRHSIDILKKKSNDFTISFYQIDCFINETNEKKFNHYITANKLVYLKSHGNDIKLSELPLKLEDMNLDYYRGLAWILKKGKLYYDLDINYSEFTWANKLRLFFSPKNQDYSSKAIEDLYKHIEKNQKHYKDLPGFKENLPSKKEFLRNLKKLDIL